MGKVAIINNESVNFKLDTGADHNLLPYELLGKLRMWLCFYNISAPLAPVP